MPVRVAAAERVAVEERVAAAERVARVGTRVEPEETVSSAAPAEPAPVAPAARASACLDAAPKWVSPDSVLRLSQRADPVRADVRVDWEPASGRRACEAGKLQAEWAASSDRRRSEA